MDSKAEKIIEKIKALRNIANSTHSKHEKETAFALASKLIAEHQISEAEIEIKTGKGEEDDLVNGAIIYETGRSTPWKTELVWGLAELNNTYALKFPIRDSKTHRQGSRYRIFGKPSDIQITIYMFEYLTSTISELVNDYVPTGFKRGVNPARESWCLGCVRGFLNKMDVERRQVFQSASTSTAMVLVNRQQQIKKAYEEKHKVKISQTAASKAQHDYNYFDSGFQKGKTLTVNPGLNGNETEIKKLR